jgi:hypothetical protein
MSITHAANPGRHPIVARKDDLYETPPEAVRALLRVEIRLGTSLWPRQYRRNPTGERTSGIRHRPRRLRLSGFFKRCRLPDGTGAFLPGRRHRHQPTL